MTANSNCWSANYLMMNCGRAACRVHGKHPMHSGMPAAGRLAASGPGLPHVQPRRPQLRWLLPMEGQQAALDHLGACLAEGCCY